MYFSKEKFNFSSPSHHKTPYSRPVNQKSDTTVSKILSKPKTAENNYGRSFVPVKPFSLNNSYVNSDVQIYHNYDEPSTSYANESTYNYPDDVYGVTITSCYGENMRNRSEYETVHFRPRKSQLVNRNFDNNYDHSVDMKMMSLADQTEVLEKTKNSNFKTTSENGSVENILQWGKLRNGFEILFEVTATLDFIQQGKWKTEKIFALNDSKSGFKLQVVYHEIDRPLPRFPPNCLVTCIGRLIARNRLQAYKVEECTEDKKKDLQRLSFICNRVADEIVAAGKKTE